MKTQSWLKTRAMKQMQKIEETMLLSSLNPYREQWQAALLLLFSLIIVLIALFISWQMVPAAF